MPDYIEIEKDFMINSPAGLNDILSECYSQNTGKVLLKACNLPQAFFDISSGFAGEVLQKLTNYKIQTAIVVDVNIKTSSMFSQMAADANRLSCVHFFNTRDEADRWLKFGG